MPRFVFERVQRAVASTASRIGRAERRVAARRRAARRSRRRWRGSLRTACRRNGGRATRCLASARWLRAGRRAAPPRRCRTSRDADRPPSRRRGAVSCRKLRDAWRCARRARAPRDARRWRRRRRPRWPAAAPASRDAVHLEHEDAAVARRQQIDAGVVGADGRGRAQASSLPRRRQIEWRGAAPPRDTLVRQSPSRRRRSMAPSTRPPTTNTRTSRPP